MITRFFITRFFYQFCLFFALIMLILGASNILVRLPVITAPSSVFWLFLTMLPLMALFAFPIASALAVGSVIGDMMIDDEILFIRFLRPLQWALYRSVGIFSLILTFIYIPLVLWWAPQSYFMGKQLLIAVAKKQLSNLEPQKFHTLLPGFTLFYHGKNTIHRRTELERLFLTLRHKSGERTIFTAQKGYVHDDLLYLFNGSMHVISSERYYSATFKQSEIDINKLLALEKHDSNIKHLKYLTLKALYNIKNETPDVYVELYKRIAQVMWQLLFPLFALWGIFLFGRAKSNVLINITWAGILFLISYISTGVAALVSNSPLFALCILFGPVFFIVIGLGSLYRRMA